jgi:predicted dehydrogenase
VVKLAKKEVGFVRMAEVPTEKPSEVKEIGVGMLGYAFMGKAHSNAYLKMPVFFYPPPAKPKLVAICGRTEAKVAEAARRFGYETYYMDWKDLLKDKRIELVDNGLPNNEHHDPCIAAAEAGKNVLCEKPLAMNVKEAQDMYKAVEKAKVKHMVGFNYRFVPAIRLAKKLIDEGYIGKILQFRGVYLQEWIMDPMFELVWRLQKKVCGSGALGDLGAHVLDLARFLVGDMASLCGMTKTFIEERPLPEDPTKKGKVDVDDAFIALLRFQNGAIGSVEATRFAAGRKNYERIEIHGTEGSLVFNLERFNELEVYSKRDPEDRMGFRTILVTESVHPFMDHWWPHGHIIGWEHTFVHEVYHLIDCIVNDKDVAPMGATFHDGLKCQEILDAVVKSSEKDKWISLPA